MVSTKDVLRLAAEADVDVRSARKAIERGALAVRGRPAERIIAAAKTLGIMLGVGDGKEAAS